MFRAREDRHVANHISYNKAVPCFRKPFLACAESNWMSADSILPPGFTLPGATTPSAGFLKERFGGKVYRVTVDGGFHLSECRWHRRRRRLRVLR